MHRTAFGSMGWWTGATLLALVLCSASFAADRVRDDPLSRTNLLEYRDTASRVHPVHSLADWQRRRASILDAMQVVMGPLPGKEKRGPLDIQILDEVDCGAYVRRCLSYAAEPGSRVPAYLLIPKQALR